MEKTKPFKYSANVSLAAKGGEGMHLEMVYGYNLEMIKHQARFSARAAGLQKRKLLLNIRGTDGSRRSLTVLS